jgi:fructose-1,6-bisphosphatase I
VAETGIALSREIDRAAFSGALGLAGDRNATGDAQKKLDLVSNEMVVEGLSETGLVAAIISEEMEEPKALPSGSGAPYVVCIDPLDGSSNTDINGALGTIFGVSRRRVGVETAVDAPATIPRGSDLVAAGYVMYGPSTVFTYSCGAGVFGFTLDHDRGEFLLTRDRMRCPERGRTYSANLGNQASWPPSIRKYLEHITELDPETRRPYSLRYSGALVADLHRILIEGGLYFYPADAKSPDGKLRLLYECAPLGYVVEQAGGRASTGTGRILDVVPESIHQRVPFVIGSADEVALYESFMTRGNPS